MFLIPLEQYLGNLKFLLPKKGKNQVNSFGEKKDPNLKKNILNFLSLWSYS
jgi:hypothetical protein